MSIVLKQLKILKSIDLDQVAIDTIKDHEKEIINLNRDQLRKGQKSDGDMPAYPGLGYLNYKRSLPTYFAGNKTDLYVTGDFQKEMRMRISGKEIEIYSSDWKETSLLERYGEEIFELNENFSAQSSDLTTPTFYNKIYAFLHK